MDKFVANFWREYHKKVTKFRRMMGLEKVYTLRLEANDLSRDEGLYLADALYQAARKKDLEVTIVLETDN